MRHLLSLNDADMRPLPLVVRKLKVGTLLKRCNYGSLRYSESFRDAEKLLTECRKLGLEGIVSKLWQMRSVEDQVRAVA